MKVFVTGGTGFIGSHLINSFISHPNTEIYALVRNLNNLKWLENLDLHFLEGDLLTIPSLPSDIDYIFHIAGSTKARKSADYYTVNQRGTASLFHALHSQKITPKRIIYLSSLAASGPSQDGRPVKENSIPHPVSPYGQSKLQGEIEALKHQHDFNVVVIRVGPVFGPRDKDFVSYFKFIKMGILPRFGSSQRFMSFCYVKDLIKVFNLCTEIHISSGEIFNIADPTPCTWDELGQIASQVLGKKLTKVKIPLPLIYVIALFSEMIGKLRKNPSIINRHKFKEMNQEAWTADTENARKKLDFSPDFSLREALQETIDWYLSRGWL